MIAWGLQEHSGLCSVYLGEKSAPMVVTSSFLPQIQSNQPHPSPKYTSKWTQWGCWVLERSSGPSRAQKSPPTKKGIHRSTEMTPIFKICNQPLHHKRTQVRTQPNECNEPLGAPETSRWPEVCHLATGCIEGGGAGGSHEILVSSRRSRQASLV